METTKKTTNSGGDNASNPRGFAVEIEEAWPDHQGESKRRQSGKLVDWFRAIGESIKTSLQSLDRCLASGKKV